MLVTPPAALLREPTMRTLLRAIVAAVVLALLSHGAAAQCAPIPATGCPGQMPPFCGTPPQIGTAFIWRCPPSCFGASIQQVVIVGTLLATPVPILPPLACVPPSCGLACQPIVTLPAPGMTINIPNNTALIGLMFCIQCACVNTAVPCISLTVANQVTII